MSYVVSLMTIIIIHEIYIHIPVYIYIYMCIYKLQHCSLHFRADYCLSCVFVDLQFSCHVFTIYHLPRYIPLHPSTTLELMLDKYGYIHIFPISQMLHVWIIYLQLGHYWVNVSKYSSTMEYMALGQNLVALVNIKIAGKWVFTPPTLIIIGFDTHPYEYGFQYIPIDKADVPTAQNTSRVRCRVKQHWHRRIASEASRPETRDKKKLR